jgi:hypothetical protein
VSYEGNDFAPLDVLVNQIANASTNNHTSKSSGVTPLANTPKANRAVLVQTRPTALECRFRMAKPVASKINP